MARSGRSLASFSSKYAIDEKTQCWNWAGRILTIGYGQVTVNNKGKLAHRVSYELHNGSIPRGMQVLHRCDNRRCVNPEHLFLGSQSDNIRDMYAKGRGPAGSAHKLAKLTEDQVRAIRAAKGMTQQQLADQYGVSRGRIGAILNGKAWTHVH